MFINYSDIVSILADTYAQAPTDVVAVALGPRALSVSWQHSGFGFFQLGGQFIVSVIRNGQTTRRVTVGENVRSVPFNNLPDYNYTSSTGVPYIVSVEAQSSSSSSGAVASTVTLPGVGCRNYTLAAHGCTPNNQ
jgi:hypothetical protein